MDRSEYVSMACNINSGANADVAMARNVYAHLNDEISKKLFEAKLLYAMTGDIGFLTGLDAKYRNLNSDIHVYSEKIQKGQHCLIHGAGMAGHYLARRFETFGVMVDAFIETDESKFGIDPMSGIRVISEKEMAENKAAYAGSTVIISYSKKKVADETRRRLCREIGIAEENIASGVFDFRNNSPQYFDFFEAVDNEVFVDCGCFDGATCYRFAGWCGQKGYEHIYSFEADPENYEKCKTLLEPLGKCELFPYGVSGTNEKVYFFSKGFEDSCIISKEEAEKKNFEGVKMIETISLDQVLKGKRITFLKMDIEGAEYDALLGAENIIKECKPRMAISVYHAPMDFITIADLILKMNPDYRISLRHYGFDELETILYVE